MLSGPGAPRTESRLACPSRLIPIRHAPVGPVVARTGARVMSAVTSPGRGARLVLLVSLSLLGACGGARSPEAAHQKLCRAVAAGDASALFEALDQDSRWHWMTTQKANREGYDIILSNYPEGVERERQLRRFERGATLGSGRALFVEEVGQSALPTLHDVCAPDTRLELAGDGASAVAVAPSGKRWPFRRGSRGSWGYAGFADDADDRQKRAVADVEQVRLNAADFERAATRAGR